MRESVGGRGPPVLRRARKRANGQVAISVHAAPDTASCPLEWELFLPEDWMSDHQRRRRAGIPDRARPASRTLVTLGLPDRLAAQGLPVPVTVADAGYGRAVSFRLAPEERGWFSVMAVDPKEIARPATAEPYQPAYGGLGPPTLPRYRRPTRPPTTFTDAGARFEQVAWRTGSKGVMASRFAVVEVRPSGREACRTAQEHAGGRSRWDGVLPLRTLLVEQPDGAPEPTGYWMTNLPSTTPVADLVRWAKMRWRGWHHHVTLVTAAQALLTLRRPDPKAHTPA